MIRLAGKAVATVALVGSAAVGVTALVVFVLAVRLDEAVSRQC